MEGEEKKDNKISFVERIGREAGRDQTTINEEGYKKGSTKKEIWVLEDITGGGYNDDVRAVSDNRGGAKSSWLQRGRSLFDELFNEGGKCTFKSLLLQDI